MQISNIYSNPYLTPLQSQITALQQDSNTQKAPLEDSTQNLAKDFTSNQENLESTNGEKLDESQIQQVRELEQIDRDVKAHEAAHIAAGAGVVTGGASFSYTRGPDGKMYATAGEVPISMEKGDTPQETIANARKIIAAAMAPSDPSPQDYKVAASAAQMEIEAKIELTQEKREKEEKFNKNQDNLNTNRDTAIASYTQNLHY
ncbi:putative metalloprotease CJM1_0395 family protein [Helicobacter mesocricetorum]|uniref:putative metalloprotease CJM1_0395 family protein n=1 Tax=Helicobacter mesocricetorum TaxID=87012 RepID=UPI000CF1AFBF|nr:putative metalloprotease CJM1_0395 family protein [Helicobacter mesocricetorum]